LTDLAHAAAAHAKADAAEAMNAAKDASQAAERAGVFANLATLKLSRMEQALTEAEDAANSADVSDDVLFAVHDALATARAELDKIRVPEGASTQEEPTHGWPQDAGLSRHHPQRGTAQARAVPR
jgi:hypothetical protein